MTLAYVPKLLAVFVVIGVLGPWMLRTAVDYAGQIFAALPALAR